MQIYLITMELWIFLSVVVICGCIVKLYKTKNMSDTTQTCACDAQLNQITSQLAEQHTQIGEISSVVREIHTQLVTANAHLQVIANNTKK